MVISLRASALVDIHVPKLLDNLFYTKSMDYEHLSSLWNFTTTPKSMPKWTVVAEAIFDL